MSAPLERAPHALTPRNILRIFLNYDAGIMPAKAKGIAQRRPYSLLLWFPESEVQTRIQLGIVRHMVNGRRDLVVYDAHDTGDRFDHARRAQTMSRHRLGGTDINAIRL